jgi:general secretion pathway protein F
MPTYSGKVQTRTGIKTVELVASSEDAARAQLKKSGKVIALDRVWRMNFSSPLSSADRQIFFSRLSAMLQSRIGAGESLQLIRDTFTGNISAVAGNLYAYVESGEDLAGAINKIGAPDFPQTTCALITAGSRSGDTWKSLQDAAAFEQEMHHVRKSAGKGLISAFAGFVFAGATILVSTLYMGPEIMKSDFISMGGGSVEVQWILDVGNVIGVIIAIILVFAGMLAMLGGVGRRLFPVPADNLIMKIPYYRDLILSRNNYTILYGLALLIKSGVRVEEALRLSMDTAPKSALKNDLALALLAVQQGKPWAMAMKTLHPTDKAALASSMDREQIARTLDALARQYRELYAQRLGSFVPTLNMAAALLLSIAGGIMFGLTILPMLQAGQGVMGG